MRFQMSCYRRAALLSGTLLVSGCPVVQRNLDVLFSPGAFDNRLIAPFTAVWPLLQFLVRTFGEVG